MVTLAFDYFGMDIFHDINTVVSLVCCLAKCKGFSNMPTSFKYVWDYCRNIFPQHMHQFFQLVNVMINCQYCNSIDDVILFYYYCYYICNKSLLYNSCILHYFPQLLHCICRKFCFAITIFYYLSLPLKIQLCDQLDFSNQKKKYFF